MKIVDALRAYGLDSGAKGHTPGTAVRCFATDTETGEVHEFASLRDLAVAIWPNTTNTRRVRRIERDGDVVMIGGRPHTVSISRPAVPYQKMPDGRKKPGWSIPCRLDGGDGDCHEFTSIADAARFLGYSRRTRFGPNRLIRSAKTGKMYAFERRQQ